MSFQLGEPESLWCAEKGAVRLALLFAASIFMIAFLVDLACSVAEIRP
jgi:hypothetical protein